MRCRPTLCVAWRLTDSSVSSYTFGVVRSFRHKGLKEVFERGTSGKVAPALVDRCRRRLDVLNQAAALLDVNIPGFSFHPLRGKPPRYSTHVNGRWCITFEWNKGDAYRVDLEEYH